MAAGEECDDLESWEEMEDSGVLDKKLEKLKAAMSSSLQKEFRSGGNGNGSGSGKSEAAAVVFLADDGRTRYVPPEPTVKILKRPPILNNSHNAGGDGFVINGDNSVKPKQPIKTLQQREIEYAEARLRILGEAQSPDERPALLERIRRIQNKSELSWEASGMPVEQTCAGAGSVANSPVLLSSSASGGQPMMIMTQTGGANTMTGQYNMNANANSVNTIGFGFNNGCWNIPSSTLGNQFGHQFGGGGGGYSKGLSNHNHHPHPHPHPHDAKVAAFGVCSSPTPVCLSATTTTATTTATAGIINTSICNNFVTIQTPFSLNTVIRQPRGPDGTKGFNHFRTSLR